MAKRALVDPPAAQMNARRITLFGTLLFFIAFVALAVAWTWVGEHGHRIWFWTSLAGWVLGLLGNAVMLRHKRLGRTI